GEVNPTHAYYNGSCSSKDTEDPSWSTSFKTRSTQKTSLALEALWKTLFVLYLYLIGTLLQVTQKDDGIFISQDKYVDEILKKFGFLTVKTTSTPMETSKPLMKDENTKDVDVHLYRSTIGSLMYLTSSRHDIMFAVNLKLGLWYPKDSPFDLEAYTDSDYAGQAIVANSTTEAEYVDAASCCGQETATARTLDNGEIELTATIDGNVKIVTEASVRRHLQLADSDGIIFVPTTEIFEQLSLMGRTNRQESMVPQPRSPTQSPVADEAASTSVDVRYGGATTTITGLEAGQGSGNIDKTLTMPQDSPLPRVNTLGSDEGSMTIQELMVFCTILSKKVESLETDLKHTKLTYDAAYTKLIKKLKKLENKVKSNQARRRAKIIVFDDEDDLEDPSKQGRKIAKIDQDPAISLDVSTAKPVSTAVAAVTTASVAVVSIANPTRRVSTADDITMAETLVYIRKSASKNKGKSKIDESKTVHTKTKLQQEQERLGYEAAVRLQTKLEEEERQRITRRLQAEEREMYTEAEQARMLVDLINQRKRYFTAQRAEERRNKPPTQAQQRTYMSNYIKHMGSHTLQ
ncbi:hypothetical protein Tco_0950331, partial [Tanacetum coccineum]